MELGSFVILFWCLLTNTAWYSGGMFHFLCCTYHRDGRPKYYFCAESQAAAWLFRRLLHEVAVADLKASELTSTASFPLRSFSWMLPSPKVMFLFFAIAINLCDINPACQQQVNKGKHQESPPWFVLSQQHQPISPVTTKPAREPPPVSFCKLWMRGRQTAGEAD